MKKICAFLIIITLISLGCGGKEKVKPSADSIITQNVLRTIDVIKDAYQKKDGTTLQENLYPILSEDVLKELFFETVELSFTPRMVKISDSKTIVHLNWHGTWVIRGKTFKNRGVGILVFQRETLKLIQIDGDNPFQTPVVK